MARYCTASALLIIALSCAARVEAQPPPLLAPETPLTLRPVPGLDPLARAVARALALRMEVPIAVGEAPPPEILEAVPVGHCAMGRERGTVLLVLAGPEGQVYRAEVAIGRRDQEAVRAIALAVEALRDAALDGPPEGEIPTSTRRTFERDGQEVTWIYREREGGLFGPRPNYEAIAKPAIYLGGVGGFSTQRGTGFFGARIGLGLCVEGSCLLLEGDVPALPEESVGCDGRGIQYRPVILSLRFLFRPFVIDDTSFGFGLGILSRFGVANLVGVDVSRLATDFGVRSSVEVAWRFAAPFEFAFEVGADVAVSPARFVRMPRPPPGRDCPTIEEVLIEDIVTVWSSLVLRVRG